MLGRRGAATGRWDASTGGFRGLRGELRHRWIDPFSKQLCVYRANIGQEIGDGKMEEAKEEFAFLLSVRGRVLSWWRMNDDEASLDNVHGLMVPVSPHTRYENDIKGHVTGKVRSARLS